MISEVTAGVLTEVIAGAGRRIGIATLAIRGRRYAEDSAIARWFDTYRLTDRVPALPDASPELDEWLTAHLNSDEVQAVLHELLAARLTDAPETDIERIRTVLELTLSSLDPPFTDIEGLAAGLFDYYDGEICTLVGQLEGTEPAFWQEIRSEAMSARLIAVLHAIERHVAALSSRTDLRSEAAFLARYRRHVVEQHGKIEPPDFERRRRVPIASLYVAPAIVQLVSAEAELKPRELDLWQLNKELDRTVLLGDPGGGKTTAAHVLMHHHAADPTLRVPFLVTLREFAAQDPPERSVAGHIEHQLDTFYQCPAPAGLVDRLLLTGRALVIFDGLDELLDTSRRAEVTTRVERFCTEYPLIPVLVTSRLVGYDQARLDERLFTRYRIGGFTDDLVSDYVVKWFAQEDGIDEPSRWADAFLEESASVPDLRANPLMLALMCILYRGEGSLPRNRAEVYEQCANLLFRKWDARRRIYAELRAGHHLEAALRHLAWWLFSRDQPQPAVTERELVTETSSFLLSVGFEAEAQAREAASEFVRFCRGRMWVFSDTGTTRDGEELYSFTHRTFLEFFASAHLAYSCDTVEELARVLAPHAARQEWEVVGELAVQIKNNTSNRGAQRIYAAMLRERRRRAAAGRGGVLQFLARCLRSVDPSPAMIRELSKEILDRFFAGNPNEPALYLPVCWLLASCVNCADIVEHEFGSKVAAMVASNERESRLALSLLFWMRMSIKFANDNCPQVPDGNPISLYWRECQERYQKKYAEDIRVAAELDAGVRVEAYLENAIRLSDALEMAGGLSPFFRDTPRRVFGVSFVAPFPLRTRSILGNPDEGRVLEELGCVGRYLLAHPQPPWVVRPVFRWTPEDWPSPTQGDISYPAMDADAYLGAAAIMLITIESMEVYEPPITFGPLGDLQPYAKHRWQGGLGGPLPSLPIPTHFRRIFQEWANNEVDLIKASADDPHSESGI